MGVLESHAPVPPPNPYELAGHYRAKTEELYQPRTEIASITPVTAHTLQDENQVPEYPKQNSEDLYKPQSNIILKTPGNLSEGNDDIITEGMSTGIDRQGLQQTSNRSEDMISKEKGSV